MGNRDKKGEGLSFQSHLPYLNLRPLPRSAPPPVRGRHRHPRSTQRRPVSPPAAIIRSFQPPAALEARPKLRRTPLLPLSDFSLRCGPFRRTDATSRLPVPGGVKVDPRLSHPVPFWSPSELGLSLGFSPFWVLEARGGHAPSPSSSDHQGRRWADQSSPHAYLAKPVGFSPDH
ncbi:hypothetical protein V6N13_040557 [Hibiscus sabdariffa]